MLNLLMHKMNHIPIVEFQIFRTYYSLIFWHNYDKIWMGHYSEDKDDQNGCLKSENGKVRLKFTYLLKYWLK